MERIFGDEVFGEGENHEQSRVTMLAVKLCTQLESLALRGT
jgi:hypothetical protein